MVNPARHDFTRETYGNGWAILDFDFLEPKKVKITAFGLKRDTPHATLEEAYLSPGEEIVITMPDGEALYEISTIHYHRDPYDMFNSELNYIQHLTGFRSIFLNDKVKQARTNEWRRQKSGEVISEN